MLQRSTAVAPVSVITLFYARPGVVTLFGDQRPREANVYVTAVQDYVQLENCIALNKHNTVFARSGELYATVRCFPGPTKFVDANGISIASAVFAGLTR